MSTKCECGHEKCFHRQAGALDSIFGGDKPACAQKGCACLRFTPQEE